MLENEVLISYAWGGESERIVDEIDKKLQQKDVKLIRDKRNLSFKKSIKEFMERIGRGNCIIVVISDKYLRSENCMFELIEIAKNQNFQDRIFPVVLQDANIYKAINRIKYIRHWEDQIDELNIAIKTVNAANLEGITDDINLYTQIRATISKLTDILKDMNTLTPEIHENSDFSQLIEALIERVKTTQNATQSNELEKTKKFTSLESVSYTPEYPYQEFKTSFRDIVAPKRYIASNSVLNLVFGSISDIREMTVTIPINQSFDFLQRGSKSVLASFERITIGEGNFFDVLEEIWPVSQRPSQAGIGHAHFLKLSQNSHFLNGVIFAVTTRNLNSYHYGQYVDTPVEGIDYILDKVFEVAKETRINSIALPLLGTGYANANVSFSHSELRLLIQQIVLALTIQKLESCLTSYDSELKRGVIVVYSPQPEGQDEHKMWDFAVRLLNKDLSKRSQQIEQLIENFSQQRSALL